jgi:hypothetical protein
MAALYLLAATVIDWYIQANEKTLMTVPQEKLTRYVIAWDGSLAF